MHPILRDVRRLALYELAWAIAGLVLSAALWSTHRVGFGRAVLIVLPIVWLFGLVCLSAWWVCRRVPLEHTPSSRLATALVGAMLQASAMWVGPSTPWLVWTAGRYASRAELLTVLAAMFAAGIPIYAMSLAIHYLVLAFEASREAERRVLESQVSTREAELRALRAQLNPHFLFNSLNSINALVRSDPEGARRMCESLGDFLRRTLALGAREAVTLEEELSLVDRYFAIEHVRFGDRLQVRRTIAPDAEACLVPPLLLQPLVENAVKHGIAQRVEGGTIQIDASVADGTLSLSVENDVDDDAAMRRGEGVGLENVRRRLDALSFRDTRLDARRENGRFKVALTLPARRAAAEGVTAHA
jgi:two-component sensor histidine kinase